MAETNRKRAQIVSGFTDAGTGERFEAGSTALIDAGAFGNYEAAGLVSAAPSPRKPRPAPAAAPKAKRRTKAPAAAPADPPAPATGEGDATT
ncbi:MAG TPA: hypothetical protein VF680_11685 [Allosphingosinicella sp.]|jgi:hypothetical protein